MTHARVAIAIARVVGVPAPRIHLPRTLMGPLATAVDLFNRVWPRDPLVEGNQVRLMHNSIYYDASKAQLELNLDPPVPFEASVERTFHWYRANGYL
jgi:nucleoside-diphosphate-sugar epimerase